MPRPRLHLDADTSIKALHQTLEVRGYDITRTPTGWMPRDTSDEAQLLGAPAQGRVLFTFNVRNYIPLARRHPEHAGIVLAAQRSRDLSDLIAALDWLLSETDAGGGTRKLPLLPSSSDLQPASARLPAPGNPLVAPSATVIRPLVAPVGPQITRNSSQNSFQPRFPLVSPSPVPFLLCTALHT
jgi:hypothetical protein